MFKFITIAVTMIACVAAAPGLASLGHGSILGGYGYGGYASPLALPAPISYGAPITKIAAPISYSAPIAKIAAPAYAPLGGHLGLGYGAPIYGAPIAKYAAAPYGISGHGLGLGLGAHGYELGAHGYGLGAHGLGAPIW